MTLVAPRPGSDPALQALLAQGRATATMESVARTPPQAGSVFTGLCSAAAQLEPEEMEGQGGSTPNLGVWFPLPIRWVYARSPPSSREKQLAYFTEAVRPTQCKFSTCSITAREDFFLI